MRGDAYDRRARLAPAGIVAAPLVLLVPQLLDASWHAVLISLASLAGLTLILQEIVRSRGRRVERKLAKLWDGLPTTVQLRASGTMQAIQKRRRSAVSQIAGRPLPTWRRQEKDPISADAEIVDVVRICLESVRQHHQSAVLLDRENRMYGFRRNTYALKSVGLAVLFLVSVVTIWVQVHHLEVVTAVVAGIIIAALTWFWLWVVRPSWVREQADIFAERFFTTIDAIAK